MAVFRTEPSPTFLALLVNQQTTVSITTVSIPTVSITTVSITEHLQAILMGEILIRMEEILIRTGEILTVWGIPMVTRKKSKLELCAFSFVSYNRGGSGGSGGKIPNFEPASPAYARSNTTSPTPNARLQGTQQGGRPPPPKIQPPMDPSRMASAQRIPGYFHFIILVISCRNLRMDGPNDMAPPPRMGSPPPNSYSTPNYSASNNYSNPVSKPAAKTERSGPPPSNKGAAEFKPDLKKKVEGARKELYNCYNVSDNSISLPTAVVHTANFTGDDFDWAYEGGNEMRGMMEKLCNYFGSLANFAAGQGQWKNQWFVLRQGTINWRETNRVITVLSFLFARM